MLLQLLQSMIHHCQTVKKVKVHMKNPYPMIPTVTMAAKTLPLPLHLPNLHLPLLNLHLPLLNLPLLNLPLLNLHLLNPPLLNPPLLNLTLPLPLLQNLPFR